MRISPSSPRISACELPTLANRASHGDERPLLRLRRALRLRAEAGMDCLSRRCRIEAVQRDLSAASDEGDDDVGGVPGRNFSWATSSPQVSSIAGLPVSSEIQRTPPSNKPRLGDARVRAKLRRHGRPRYLAEITRHRGESPGCPAVDVSVRGRQSGNAWTADGQAVVRSFAGARTVALSRRGTAPSISSSQMRVPPGG